MATELRGWIISGKVQGVFFRESTRRQAEPLGLTGYAINLPDGTVEVAARGERGQVDQLAEWLEKGPAAARVDAVRTTEPQAERLPDRGFVTG